MTELLAGALPGRDIRVVADSAYAGGELKKLPAGATWTTRLRKDAALYGLPPDRTGRRGRPRHKGDRLPCLAELAAATAFTQVTVTRYGKAAGVRVAAVTCLWPSVFGSRPVTVVLIRDRSASGYDLALVTTDTAATAARVIKTQPSTADMTAKLRRVIIAARFKAYRPDQPTPEEIRVIRLAWENLAA